MNPTRPSLLSNAARLGAVLLILGIAAYFFFHKRGAPSASAAPTSSSRAVTSAPGPAPASPTDSAEARRARDAMRDQILDALRKKRDASAAPAPAPAAQRASTRSTEGDEPVGHYEAAYIQQVFREDMFPLLRKCYEGALARKPQLAGKLVITFRIIGDPSVGGVVEDAAFADESDLKDEEMETCVRESTMTLTFDKPPRGGGAVTVKYPVLFSPGDDEDDEDGGAPPKERDGGKG